MSDKLYDTLAFIGRLVLPALGTLYFALAKLWDLPYGVEIEGSFLAVSACINTILKREYNNWLDTQMDDEEDDINGD